MQGTAKTISGVQPLGRYRLRIRLKRRAGDFVARLTMPYFCPIPPGTPADRRIDVPPGIGAVLRSKSASPTGASSWNGIPTTPAVCAPPIPTASSGRSRTIGSRDAGRPSRARTTSRRCILAGRGRPRPRRQVRREPARSRGLRLVPDHRDTALFRFNLQRPAFKGAGQAPLRKAINYALDRPALTGAFGYLAGRPSDRLLPAALRARANGLYPLRGPDPDTARRWLARAGIQAADAHPLHGDLPGDHRGRPGVRLQPEAARHRGRARSTSRSRYCSRSSPHRGSRGTSHGPPGPAFYPDPAAVSRPAPPRHEVRGTGQRSEPADGRRRPGQGLGQARGRSHASTTRPWRCTQTSRFRALVSRNFGCWSGAPGVHAFRRQENDLDLGAVCKR